MSLEPTETKKKCTAKWYFYKWIECELEAGHAGEHQVSGEGCCYTPYRICWTGDISTNSRDGQARKQAQATTVPYRTPLIRDGKTPPPRGEFFSLLAEGAKEGQQIKRKLVKIPFRARFKDPMLKGKKTMTSRPRIFGAKGDYFEAFGAIFQIDSVDAQPFKIIELQWEAEGCSSKEDFLAVWRGIHPRHKPEPNELFYVHRFHEVVQKTGGNKS